MLRSVANGWVTACAMLLTGAAGTRLLPRCLAQSLNERWLIEEVAPGRQSCPFHYHLLEEEQALVLAGHGTLRLGDETYELKPWDYVCFPAGQRAGHCFINNGTEPFRYMMIGERKAHDVCVYPDSNKLLVRALDREHDIFDMGATKGYWDGEKTER